MRFIRRTNGSNNFSSKLNLCFMCSRDNMANHFGPHYLRFMDVALHHLTAPPPVNEFTTASLRIRHDCEPYRCRHAPIWNRCCQGDRWQSINWHQDDDIRRSVARILPYTIGFEPFGYENEVSGLALHEQGSEALPLIEGVGGRSFLKLNEFLYR